MNREDIIRMAREAGSIDSEEVIETVYAAFSALIKQHLIQEGYRQCAQGQRTTQFCGLLEAAVRLEREACAQRLDAIGCDHCAAAIRARGEPQDTDNPSF